MKLVAEGVELVDVSLGVEVPELVVELVLEGTNELEDESPSPPDSRMMVAAPAPAVPIKIGFRTREDAPDV